MKKVCLLVLCALALFVVVGCASTSPAVNESVKTAASQIPVVLGKNDIPRPDWVFQDQSTAELQYAAGYGKMANTQNSMKKAQTEARNLLAEYVSTAVKEITTTYSNDAGTDGNRQAIDAFESVSMQKSQAVLSGANQMDMWEDVEGGVWILMSIPKANVASQMYDAAKEAASKSFEKNEAAVEANKMMDDAIAKYFGGI